MIKSLFGVDITEFDLRLIWFLHEFAKRDRQEPKMRETKAVNAGLDEDSLEYLRVQLESTFKDLYTPEHWDKYELDAGHQISKLSKNVNKIQLRSSQNEHSRLTYVRRN
jgi:hypothetical protein